MSAAHISGKAIACPKYTYCLDYPFNLKIYLPKVNLYAAVLVD